MRGARNLSIEKKVYHCAVGFLHDFILELIPVIIITFFRLVSIEASISQLC